MATPDPSTFSITQTTITELDPLDPLEREATILEAAELLVGSSRRLEALELERIATEHVLEQARSTLEELTAEGEVVDWQEGEEPLVRMPPRQEGRRSVRPGGLELHRAELEPLGIAPRVEDVPPVPATTRTVYPAVAELDRYRDRLEAAGVNFEDLVDAKRWGPARFLPLSEAQEEARKAAAADAKRPKHPTQEPPA